MEAHEVDMNATPNSGVRVNKKDPLGAGMKEVPEADSEFERTENF